jgi:hypothetical protein
MFARMSRLLRWEHDEVKYNGTPRASKPPVRSVKSSGPFRIPLSFFPRLVIRVSTICVSIYVFFIVAWPSNNIFDKDTPPHDNRVVGLVEKQANT